jgi:hypothetical protein
MFRQPKQLPPHLRIKALLLSSNLPHSRQDPSTPARPYALEKHISRSPSLRMTDLKKTTFRRSLKLSGATKMCGTFLVRITRRSPTAVGQRHRFRRGDSWRRPPPCHRRRPGGRSRSCSCRATRRGCRVRPGIRGRPAHGVRRGRDYTPACRAWPARNNWWPGFALNHWLTWSSLPRSSPEIVALSKSK